MDGRQAPESWRPWVRGLIFDGVLLAVWAASASLVVLHEQGGFRGGSINPLTSLGATLEAKEQWFGLYYQGQKIGFTQTSIVPEELDGVPGVVLSDRGRLSFTLLGVPQQLELYTRASLDADWRLQRFAAELKTDAYRLRWSGKREGGSLLMSLETEHGQSRTRLRDPGRGMLVVGLSPWTAFHRLKVGQWGSVWILNPLALKPEEVFFHVRSQGRFGGRDVLLIDTDFRGMTTTSWVTPSGEVMKEESPLGWQLVAESREHAMDMPKEAPSGFDLLSTLAVPIDRPLPAPNRIERMVWLVAGSACEDLLPRSGQTVLPPEQLSQYHVESPPGSWCLVELRKSTPPAPEVFIPPPAKRYTRPSLFIQADHPAIQQQARAIAGRLRDPWRRVMALNEWVHRLLAKRLTVGLPSALDVLASMSGDCHEHTILFTALARSLGLSTRMVAGLVYYDGRLFYHAWPEVWLGGAWIPTDPTLGQPLADATHLGLVEAEDEQLIALGRFIGQLRVSVLALEEAGTPAAAHGP